MVSFVVTWWVEPQLLKEMVSFVVTWWVGPQLLKEMVSYGGLDLNYLRKWLVLLSHGPRLAVLADWLAWECGLAPGWPGKPSHSAAEGLLNTPPNTEAILTQLHPNMQPTT